MTSEEFTTLTVVVFVLCLLLVVYLLRRTFSAPRKAPPPPLENCVIVDGSNVMHWKDGTPNIETVRTVVNYLASKGFTPGVVFDANAGYLLIGKYQHDAALSRALGLPENRVMVVPKGMQADPAILTAAREFNGRVVSNDRFRDWGQQFPEIKKPGHLIRGGFRSGVLSLHLTPQKKSRKKRSA